MMVHVGKGAVAGGRGLGGCHSSNAPLGDHPSELPPSYPQSCFGGERGGGPALRNVRIASQCTVVPPRWWWREACSAGLDHDNIAGPVSICGAACLLACRLLLPWVVLQARF